MMKTSKTKRFMSTLMKHLKFAIALPFKALVRFYMLIETIFEDGKQKNRRFLRSITYLENKQGFQEFS